jgi:hypothetical protein
MTTNQSPNGKQASHFHCYLLRSLDPSHPHKTYIGFTVSHTVVAKSSFIKRESIALTNRNVLFRADGSTETLATTQW